MSNTLLDVRDLSINFHTEQGEQTAVKNLSLLVEKGKTLALVGESGCGKSVTSLAIMQLLPGIANITHGSVNFQNKNILKLGKEQMRALRGKDIAMIFQEPMTALNPVFTVGQQITETILIHKKISASKAKQQSIRMLTKVKIPDPEKRYDEYPHQLSGGMKQRILIAMALCCDPKLLIADEPTTALDVTIQAQILSLIKDLQLDSHMAMIFITHDLGVVAQIADDVAVMYAGRVIEQGSVYDIFDNPAHPYTKGLLQSIPKIDENISGPLPTIKGNVPNLFNRSSGCLFNNRCQYKKEICTTEHPPQSSVTDHHKVWCYRFKEI
jgi:peptide/nickel transport system ATP-binding protein